MSEELNHDLETELETDEQNAPEEFEEISSDEVDRIVEALEALIGSTDSENIQTYLEEAMNNVYYLVYDEESEDDSDTDDEIDDDSDDEIVDEIDHDSDDEEVAEAA